MKYTKLCMNKVVQTFYSGWSRDFRVYSIKQQLDHTLASFEINFHKEEQFMLVMLPFQN